MPHDPYMDGPLPEDDIPWASQADVDELRSAISTSFINFHDSYGNRFQEIEQTVHVLEETVAALVAGFAEQAIMIEAILGQLSMETTEEREAFAKVVSEGRAAMFRIMQESSDVLAETDPGIASAMERVVEEKRTASSGE